MNNTTNDITLIERYFDNELSNEEKDQVLERLNSDHEFQRLFDTEKLLVNTIRYEAIANDLKFLKQLEGSLASGKAKPLKSNFYWYTAVAACVSLFIVAWLFFPTAQSSDDIFDGNFKPHPNVFEPVVRGTQEKNQRSEAFQAYEQGNYARASELFSTLLKDKKEAGVLLLLGNANLALGKTELAKANFNELISEFDELDMQAKWYLSLSYLKNGEIVEAKKIWQELGNTDFSYSQKAKELLKKVE